MKRLLYLFFLWIGGFLSFYGQSFSEDTIHINEIKVVETRTALLSDADKKDQIDTLILQEYQNHDLSYLLSKSSLACVNNYGSYGALSSVRLRGGGSSHTAVLWNGLPINSLTSGGADLSMVNVGAFDEVNVIYGASGSVYGTGTFGGAVELNNYPRYDQSNELKMDNEVGSFSNYRLRLSSRVSSLNLSYSGQIFFLDGKNDFTYNDILEFENPKETISHAENREYGTIHSLFYKLNQHTFNAGIWYQHKNHNIPGTMGGRGAPKSLQTQKDSSLKVILGWQLISNNIQINLHSGYIKDGLKYILDPSYISSIGSQRWLNNGEVRCYFNDHWILSSLLSYNNLVGNVDEYNRLINENETKWSIASKYKTHLFLFNASIEKGWNSVTSPPFMFSISSLIQLLPRRIDVRAKIASHYRRPTLNDRYWPGGGNMNLESERGVGWEIGMVLKGNNEHQSYSLDLNYYLSDNENQIEWIPSGGSSIAENSGKVLSNGVETKLKLSSQWADLRLDVNIGYTYRNTYYNDPSDTKYKEILPYQPKHLFRSNFTGVFKNIVVGWNCSFQSVMYSAIIENAVALKSNRIKEFFLTDGNVAYSFNLMKVNCVARLRVENILNKQYQLIYSYPMPGRSYWFGLTFKI